MTARYVTTQSKMSLQEERALTGVQALTQFIDKEVRERQI